jgi:hypothetical protein
MKHGRLEACQFRLSAMAETEQISEWGERLTIEGASDFSTT